jgi:hypothetical protein
MKDFRDKIFELQGKMDDKFKTLYEKEDYFVGWDFDYRRYACGSIHNLKLVGKNYLDVVNEVLVEFDDSNDWVYNTVFEINGMFELNEYKSQGICEIFSVKNKCYINSDLSDSKLIDLLLKK